MIETYRDQKNWNSTLQEIGGYDFYHIHEYHHLFSKPDKEPIILVYSEEGEPKAAIPFLKRQVSGEWKDLSSVHGYLGPVLKDSGINIERFQSEFLKYLAQNKVVSVFSKLNPFIKGQLGLIKGLGNVENVGELVYFDQSESDDEQLQNYSRTSGQRLRKLRRISSVIEANSEDDIAYFVDYYHKHLDYLNAKDRFYYPISYFETLLNSDMVDAKMLFAVLDGSNEIMGGAFCVGSGILGELEIMWTHPDHFKLSPPRILYDECRAIFKDPVKYLNLGGGTGGREGSLMKFKATFTQHYADYNVWKWIVLPEVYEELQNSAQRASDSNYFPKYRIKT